MPHFVPIGPAVSVAVPEFVLMLVRILYAVRAVSRKKHAKNNIYTGVGAYIDNYNSCPNLTTSTSLTFFTAIFLPFSGALAEVLMVMCRRVTTNYAIGAYTQNDLAGNR